MKEFLTNQINFSNRLARELGVQELLGQLPATQNLIYPVYDVATEEHQKGFCSIQSEIIDNTYPVFNIYNAQPIKNPSIQDAAFSNGILSEITLKSINLRLSNSGSITHTVTGYLSVKYVWGNGAQNFSAQVWTDVLSVPPGQNAVKVFSVNQDVYLTPFYMKPNNDLHAVLIYLTLNSDDASQDVEATCVINFDAVYARSK